ncbi:FlgO family outer membrane protein [Pseudocolwellia sp. AS88]|jgi:TolB-like protein|uniref:FlgO family outer membrane protein n=1 Tax=Pseudocolwellia TaxID=2848177 RepID=UPI0026E96495|nr:FlgO family outer membrane protein [Pseudocolwellia sp. AS88]MDO7085087.1 FlgO family outer membrane protein [Pseudocolwellia sp. AS88]
MKKWLILLLLPTFLSCTSNNNNKEEDFYKLTQVDKSEIDSFALPKHAINDVVKGLAYQMIESSSFVNPKTPIAIASFVNLKDLESTNWLGNQLSESFIHELQRHGLIVVDFKTTGHIRVTPDGDYAFTRDWKELPERQIIDYVVTGTMMEQDGGVMVNARMIGMQSRVVVASAQSFIPSWVIGEKLNHNDEMVNMKDGLIIRDSSLLESDKRAVEIQQ